MTDSHRVIVTCDAESNGVTLLELSRILPSPLKSEWLDTGDAVQGSILMFDPEMPFDEFSSAVEAARSIFIRHIAPIQGEVTLDQTEADLFVLRDLLCQHLDRIDPARTFAVQSRILGDGKLPYRKVSINETLSQFVEAEMGAALDCKTPEQVISVLCAPRVGYLGISDAKQNRSSWPGGRHRFKREEDQISRAEFKLLEAMSLFPWVLPTRGTALDLGAAPGGWTRVLADIGLNVDAVDPAELHPRLRHHPRVRHARCRTQDWLPNADRYDVIVNDMKMDARASVDQMLQAESILKPFGKALMTLKLPKAPQTSKGARATLGMVYLDLRRLEERFEIYGARQLYHNRSEITVAMGKRNA